MGKIVGVKCNTADFLLIDFSKFPQIAQLQKDFGQNPHKFTSCSPRLLGLKSLGLHEVNLLHVVLDYKFIVPDYKI